MEWFKILPLFIVLFLALFGGMVLISALHEYQHHYELKDYVNDSEICALSVPVEIREIWKIGGYYAYSVEDETGYGKVHRFAELRAYSFTILLAILLVVLMINVLHYYMKGRIR